MILGWLFDMWRNAWFAFHLMVDDALDVWNFGDDQEDQW